MWAYHQSSGEIDHNGVQIGVGYSGHGEGLNNGAMEAVAGIGPIPVGKWKIVRWDAQHGHLGPVVGILEPVGFDPHGRSLFRVHGDSAALNHMASDGCIIASKIVREQMRASGDQDLEVVA